MVRLFGREFTRAELQGYVGNLSQVGGIRPIELAAGRERGVRAFDLVTGGGLECTVLADRALDITRATFRGHALAYLTPGGQAHPAYYEPQGLGWLRTFPGGLVTTCGLSTAGAPGRDEGVELGQHGRISNLPMEELGHWGEWQGDEYRMIIAGSVTEGVIFESPLRLSRRISAYLGRNTLLIEDTVENLGGEPAPHMMLYHCNFGFPLVSPHTRLISNSRQVTPRDEDAAQGWSAYASFQEPTPGFREQVFYHDMATDNAGEVRVALVNPKLDGGLGVGLTYHKKSLPQCSEWKMTGYGSYVVGLEPANCRVEGRAKERDEGRLQVLQPGERRAYRLEFTVLDGPAAIDEFSARIKVDEESC